MSASVSIVQSDEDIDDVVVITCRGMDPPIDSSTPAARQIPPHLPPKQSAKVVKRHRRRHQEVELSLVKKHVGYHP